MILIAVIGFASAANAQKTCKVPKTNGYATAYVQTQGEHNYLYVSNDTDRRATFTVKVKCGSGGMRTEVISVDAYSTSVPIQLGFKSSSCDVDSIENPICF